MNRLEEALSDDQTQFLKVVHEKNIMTAKFGRCSITYNAEGFFETERWRNSNGDISRGGDKPAFISFSKNGKILTETWFTNNKMNRGGDKPAQINRNKNNVIIREEWYSAGDPHRGGDKPAIKYYHEHKPGTVSLEIWVSFGIFGRGGDKPYCVTYHDNGVIKKEQWLDKAKRGACLDAFISYDEQGNIQDSHLPEGQNNYVSAK